MGVALSLVNFNEVLRTLPVKYTVLNDVEAFTASDMERLNKLIMTTYSGDMLSNIPTCECGAIMGEYNLGVLCHQCNTRVEPVLDQDLIPLTWIRAPNGVHSLMNPLVWTMLKDHFTIGGFSLLNWICDTTYSPSSNEPHEVSLIQTFRVNNEPFQRGYNFFVENFNEMVNLLMGLKRFRVKREKSDMILKMIQGYPDCIFSTHLPIPHRSLLVVEINNTGNYMDSISPGAIDAILTLAGIDTDHHVYSQRTKENRAVKAIDQLAQFYEETYSETFAAKEGVFRKHVFATRSHWSFRAVVSSITDAHNYDEIYIPWGVATSVLKTHLLTKLQDRGWTPNESMLFIDKHAQTYHPLLDELFDELIREAPNGRGISCTLGRNPSLHRSSIQHVYISRVKKDPNIPTVSMSILIVVGLNADFDGDALNFTLAIDQKIERSLADLAPHLSTFSLQSPRVISSNLSMPKPVVATMANWLEYPSDQPDVQKLERMKSLSV